MNIQTIYEPKLDRTPYFYIIRHIFSGKFYVGSRWAINCHPDEFMKLNGYCTSSPTIEKIIEAEGLGAFEIYRLIPEHILGIDAYSYETIFLREHKIPKRDNWFNSHDNRRLSYGTQEFKDRIFDIYGVEHNSQSQKIKDKKKNTNQQIRGVDCPFQSPDVKEKIIETNNERYGADNPFQSPIIQKKIIVTNNERYGVDNPMQNSTIREKAKATSFVRHGVEHALQSPIIQDQFKLTCLKNHGVEHALQSPILKEKARETTNQNYGELNISNVRCVCQFCKHETNMSAFSKHAKKCFPLHDDVWVKPKSPEEWKKYIKPKTIY